MLLGARLAIAFGMTRVINVACGEFLMVGGYPVIMSAKAGVPLCAATLILAPLVGVIVERLIIRFLYGRILLLATSGLSLLTIGGVTMIFGNTDEGVSTPPGGCRSGSMPSRSTPSR